MEDYIMTSIETDVQFVDNASDSYMTDEEREYWIDLEESGNETYQMSDEEQQGFEEHITDEEIEPCDDIAIDNAFNSAFGYSIEDSRKIRRATKKALVDKVPNIPTHKGVEHRIEGYTNKLANHFNHQGVK
jgi:hypothetical protein